MVKELEPGERMVLLASLRRMGLAGAEEEPWLMPSTGDVSSQIL
jgi:hypothetical protein